MKKHAMKNIWREGWLQRDSNEMASLRTG